MWKKEDIPQTKITVETPAEVHLSLEQQAEIDSVDQPNPAVIAMDESEVVEEVIPITEATAQ